MLRDVSAIVVDVVELKQVERLSQEKWLTEVLNSRCFFFTWTVFQGGGNVSNGMQSFALLKNTKLHDFTHDVFKKYRIYL